MLIDVIDFLMITLTRHPVYNFALHDQIKSLGSTLSPGLDMEKFIYRREKAD